MQAFVKLTEHSNRVLNIIKAKYGLRDKSQAINLMATQYEESVMEPELRPEFVKKALKIHNQTPIKIGSVQNLRKRYEK